MSRGFSKAIKSRTVRAPSSYDRFGLQDAIDYVLNVDSSEATVVELAGRLNLRVPVFKKLIGRRFNTIRSDK